MSRADLSKDPSAVAAMFDGVAQRYDLANDVLALGQTRIWRRAVVAAIKPQPGEIILDLAAGTGTSSVPFAKAGAHVIPTDFSLGMLRVGHERQPELPFVAGDGLNLPYRDNSFDAATISFGLRNLTDRSAGLAEFRRVLKPGGRLVICEFSSPTSKPLRTLYTEYLMKALPAVATKVATNPDAYVYLAESIRAWPVQAELAEEIIAAGFAEVQWRNLTGGIVAVHRAVNP
ncbi:MAG: demethylmenaquinone methyltransferase [Actinomycetes bacterium]